MRVAFARIMTLFCITNAALACTCVQSGAPVCEQIKTSRAALFVGKVQQIGSKTVFLAPDDYPLKMQVVKFQVIQTFGLSIGDTVLITDFMPGNGSCGFPFVEGQIYLVDTWRKSDDGLYVNSCGNTAGAAEAQDLLRFLRSTTGNDRASIFGTVKEYVGEKNFVAKRNKPIPGIAVNVIGPEQSKTVATDSSGWYLITGLTPGNYDVQVDVGQNYQPVPRQTITITKAGCAQVDLRTDAAEH
jgi:hypothetical protein